MASLHVEVVSADRQVWSGEASRVVARTAEGDLGILPGHAPVLALLVPSGVEVYAEGGDREVVAVGSGFISVDQNRVAILSEYARLAGEIDLSHAEGELAEAEQALESGDNDEDARLRFEHASAQVKAARKAQ